MAKAFQELLANAQLRFLIHPAATTTPMPVSREHLHTGTSFCLTSVASYFLLAHSQIFDAQRSTRFLDVTRVYEQTKDNSGAFFKCGK
jgi:hypothetical protein